MEINLTGDRCSTLDLSFLQRVLDAAAAIGISDIAFALSQNVDRLVRGRVEPVPRNDAILHHPERRVSPLLEPRSGYVVLPACLEQHLHP